jgi:hypothetical protein
MGGRITGNIAVILDDCLRETVGRREDSERTIVIVKTLPVLQCERCSEYSFEEATFARVEELLRFAA